MSEKSKKSKKFPEPIIVISAWISVLLFGLLSVFLTLFLASVFLGGPETKNSGTRLIVLFGLFGIQVLSLIMLLIWRFRKKLFIKQLLIGMWVGVVTYGLFLVSGSVGFVSSNMTASAAEPECTDPLSQYQRNASAIVPIASNLGSGSGVVIDNQGTVLTAYHVIKDTTEVYANYSSGRVALTIVSTAPQYDLAILKLEKFESIHFSLTDNYATGDEVFAYGYPGNALTAGPGSITRGIISRVLSIADLRMTEADLPDGLEYIQTDAAINPGNSGGALIGNCGLVGIVVAVSDSAQISDYVGAVSEQGISYAVGAKTAAQAFKLDILHPQ